MNRYNLALMLISFVTIPCLAEDIRSQQYGYTLAIPSEWQIMPKAQLDAMLQAGGTTMKFEYGLNLRQPDALTYVLIRSIPDNISRLTFDQLERSLARDLNVKLVEKKIEEENLQNIVKDVQMGSAVIDRRKKRVIINIDMNIMGMAKLRCMAFGMLGKDGVTFIYCYAEQSAFAKQIPLFEKLVNGFHYDVGREYFEPSGNFNGNWFQGALNGGLIGGLIGGGVALVFTIFRKKKAA